MNIYWYWMKLSLSVMSVICCFNMGVNAPAVEIETTAPTEPTVEIELWEPTAPAETEVATEPVTEPTKLEIPTEAPTEPATEPPVTYYDVPLSEDLQSYIFRVCEERNIDPAIILVMIDRESDFREGLMGDNGDSYGLLQVQPKWHQPRMNKLGITDLLDPYQNVLVGIDYLDELLSYGGKERSIEWALMAYNGGPDYAERKTNEGILTDYAKEILNNYYILKGV